MTHAFIMTMKRPERSLGIPMPIGRKIQAVGRMGSLVAMLALTISAVGLYIYQVNRTAEKNYAVRDLEKQSEQLKDTVASLETKAVTMQSLQSLQERVKPLGYVPIDRMQFLDAAKGSYAVAK